MMELDDGVYELEKKKKMEPMQVLEHNERTKTDGHYTDVLEMEYCEK